MNNFIFSFETTEPNEYVGKTYNEEGQKHLVAGLSGCSVIKRKANYLLVPDNDSVLANHLKKNLHYDYSFNTPFSNLKFKPNFWKNSKGSISYDCLITKDTNQVKKDIQKVNEFPASLLTFKVLSQVKKAVGNSEKWYEHELEIEPLDLEIEGLPKITRLIFSFVSSLPGQTTVEKGLEKTWLYNHRILTESAEKTFTVKVRRWKLGSSNEYSYLTFADDWDFDLDSFQEKTAENGNSPPSPNQPKNNDNSTTPNGNKGLIMGVVIIFVILVLTIGFLWVRKKKIIKK